MKWLARLLMVFALVVASSTGHAQKSSGSTVDPNNFDLIHSGPDINQNTKAFSLRTQQSPDTSIRNLMMVVLGQSNCTNVAPTPYTPEHAAQVDQMSLTNGAVYNAVDPLLNLTGVTAMPLLRLADNFITVGLFDRVVLFPACAGGTSAADWDTGNQSTKMTAIMSRLTSRGWVAKTNVTVVFLWWQGEQDNVLQTPQVSYTNSLSSVIAQSRAAGFSGTWFVNVETWNSGTAWGVVQAAQAAIVNHGAGVWAGTNLDALVGTACGGVACRQADNTHLSDAGASSAATAQQTAMHAFGAPF